MGRQGDRCDNAVAESFFSSFETDRIPEDGYETASDGMADVFRYIEESYDQKRLHSYLGYVSPTAFEAARCPN